MKTNVRVAALAAVAAAAIAAPAIASHSWSTYHWQRTSSVISPPVITAIDQAKWGTYVTNAVGDWNGNDPDQTYTDYIESPGPTASGLNPKTCKAQSGKILVCNAKYGFTGWLGIAQIWLSGGHIAQGITKLNDSYFNTATYNKPEWRALVACQEIGHDYGLGHQDEDFNNADVEQPAGSQSCMDYTNQPLGNETPNGHDYEQLASMYSHSHSAFQALGPGQSRSNGLNNASGGDSPSEWGRAVHFDAQGRPDYFMMDLGGGRQKITHVFWTLEHRGGGNNDH